MTPDQFEYDELIYGKPEGFQESDSSNRRHDALHKSYRKLLQKQQSKKDKSQSSKHIDKYRHKQSHQSEDIESFGILDSKQASKIDPEMQKQINEVARAMVQKIYEEIANEDQSQTDKKQSRSFTLQKFYEQNQQQEADKGKNAQAPSGTEELEELTSDASMLKREPLQVSSEELDYNTELEQAKDQMRNEFS